MTDSINNTTPESPFHRGEHEAQNRLGVREKMERFGSRVIRDHMPDQHREFYHQLPFVFVGHADQQGWPWASILFNDPGFMTSSEPKSLEISTAPVKGDPLAEAWQPDTRLGLLGIELTTRRRNRLAAHIVEASESDVRLKVDQSFGNCPQYIQVRELENVEPGSMPEARIEHFTAFNERARDLIGTTDTFFVASYINTGSEAASEGADVSHRGGKPGFIRVDDNNTLTIPDYLGNFHFNTFGNFIENPKAGLLFLDFENGHLLTLTGTVEILWDSPDTEYFEGAERLWKFHLDHGRWLENALPLRWKLEEYSPNTLLTGSWEEAEKLRHAQAQKNQWLPYDVVEVVEESSVIKSFYLSPRGHQRPPFIPGQFLTVKASIGEREQIRTYTVSSAPADPYFRISVKRETAVVDSQPDGVFSNFLHDNIKAGDVIQAKAPCGGFIFDAAVDRPAVLIAGGIGITPMISMARHALMEGVRTRSIRPLTLISAARDSEQRAFFEELNELADKSGGHIRSFWALSQPARHLKPGVDFHQNGRISPELLQGVLPLDDYDFYLCGPSSFMQTMYDMLRVLGVSDARIYAEEFGPASLAREGDHATSEFQHVPEASEAIVEFTESKVEQAWSAGDGNLLEFAESHGFTPEFGCRSGQCGACKATLISGEVAYHTESTAAVEEGEVLLCCAVPAAIEGDEVARLAIKL